MTRRKLAAAVPKILRTVLRFIHRLVQIEANLPAPKVNTPNEIAMGTCDTGTGIPVPQKNICF